MSGTNAIVQQLLNSNNQMAAGIGYVLRALLNSAMPGKTPIIVEHMNKEGAIRVMMFSREKLSTSFSNAIQFLRRELTVSQKGSYTYYTSEELTVTGALFYKGDGTVESTQVLISPDSWHDLMAHVHKIYVRTSGA